MSTSKIDKILVLRAFAAALVFLSHLRIPDYGLYLGDFDLRWLILSDGQSGVKIFFVLSGYLIGKAFWDRRYSYKDLEGVKKFYLARIRRIVPLYYFVSIVLLATVYRKIFLEAGWLYKVAGIFTFTFDIDASPYFNAAWWALSVEMQFYLLAPALVGIIFAIGRQRVWRYWVMLIIMMFVGLVTRFVFAREIVVTSINQLRHFAINADLFVVGVIAVPIVYSLQKVKIKKLPDWGYLLSLLLVYFLLSANLYTKNIWKFKQGIINHGVLLPSFVTVVTLVVVWLYSMDGWRIKEVSVQRLKHNWLHFLEIFGLISYSYYLIHGEVLRIVDRFLGGGWIGSLVVMVISLGMSFGLSLITYYLIELRFLRTRKNY